MLVKNIIAAFALAGLATATPVEDIEARAACSGGAQNNWCCVTSVSPLNIFFIRGVGSNCIKNTSGNDCTSPKASRLCCTGNSIASPIAGGGFNVVCTI